MGLPNTETGQNYEKPFLYLLVPNNVTNLGGEYRYILS